MKKMMICLGCWLLAACSKDSFPPTPTLATVSITTLSSITSTGLFVAGTVSSTGGGVVLAQGACWSTNSDPTLSDDHTIDTSGTDYFSEYISGLTPGTTYYIRPYVVNNAGTAFGTGYSFRTAN